MAQSADMGPPMSPRETRRSGRRSALSASTSASKSPESPTEDPANTRPPLTTSNSTSSRSKKLKQEDVEDTLGEHDGILVTTRTNGVGNGRTKRKGKDKDKPQLEVLIDAVHPKSSGAPSLNLEDSPEEEQGITRCVCGSTEDDPDAGEFMVQCETCNIWQHGLCMGYEAEDQLPEGDYNCEKCRPDQHHDLLHGNRRLSKRGRHSSANSAAATSRISRSHSPSHLLKQPAKRRNTMNSRDANFDLMLQETLKATAAEAAAQDGTGSVTGNGSLNGREDLEEEGAMGAKKRKRMDDDAMLRKKRTRSASTTSDHPVGLAAPKEDLPSANSTGTKTTSVGPRGGRNHKRGGGRRPATTHETAASVDGEEVSKRQSSGRGRIGPTPKRPPASHAGGSNSTHEHGTRRNHNTVAGGTNGSNAPSSTIAYRNSHAYAVSQQTLFTSWNLPDYLAHLEHILPSDTPRPLEVLGPGLAGDVEKGMERGVKVKWPSKRMSVVDMNKRVRSLVEWVGREQAGASERRRRRESLEKTLKANEDVNEMAVDGQTVEPSAVAKNAADGEGRASTMKMMEELMEELIGFQERFGPGAKNRERERRLAATTANS